MSDGAGREPAVRGRRPAVVAERLSLLVVGVLSRAADLLPAGSVMQVLWIVVCALVSSPFFYRMGRGWRELSLPWRLVAGGLAVRLLADGVWTVEYVRNDRVAPFPAFNDLGFLASYPLLIGGLLLAGRQARGHGRRVLLDAFIVTAALATVDWVFLFHPYLHHT
ncbi:hypothetical protein AB0J06_26280, partial [Micromonospora sp. NPDC049679]